MAASIKQDLHSVSAQNEVIRDQITMSQRTINSIATGSERTEQQYHRLDTTLSTLSADIVCHSDLGRSHMTSIDDKFDQIVEYLQALSTQTGVSGMNQRPPVSVPGLFQVLRAELIIPLN